MPWQCENAPLLRATVDIPADGAWTADVALDAAEAPAGRVVLTLGDVAWSGTVVAARVDGAGTARARIVGGAGGLSTTVGWRWSRAAPFTSTDVLGELASLAGESLGSLPAPVPLPRYQRQPGTVGGALDAVTGLLGWRWRIGAAGVVDVYAPGDVPPDAEAPGVLVTQSATTAIFRVESCPDVVPSATWNHATLDVAKGRATLTLRTTSPRRVIAALGEDARPVGRVYSGRVVEQDGDRVTVEAEGWTVSDVPLFVGLPGVVVEIEPDTPCLLAYLGADPTRPVAFLFSHDSSAPSSVSIDAGTMALCGGLKTVLRDGDAVNVPGLGIVAITLVAPDTPITPAVLRSRVKA